MGGSEQVSGMLDCAAGRDGGDGGHLCAVHAAVGACELGAGGRRVLVATTLDDEGAGMVLEASGAAGAVGAEQDATRESPARLHGCASEQDLSELRRAADGSLRHATRRPIAQVWVCMHAAWIDACTYQGMHAYTYAVMPRAGPLLRLGPSPYVLTVRSSSSSCTLNQ